MITAEQIAEAGIPVGTDDETLISVESAVEFIENNTTLKIDMSDLGSLPAGAKLFIVKYTEIMSNAGIESESLGGMSQSFDTDSSTSLLWDLLNYLLGKYMKSQVSVVQAGRRWKYGR